MPGTGGRGGAVTPSDLKILIHYFVSPSPHPRIEAPAVKEATERFLSDGILEYNSEDGVCADGYRVTGTGKAWIKMILDTPYPELAFIDPRTNRLVYGE